MPIDFACPCGRRLRVSDRFAGKFARCPGCQEKTYVPGPQDDTDEPEPGEEKKGPQIVRIPSKNKSVPDKPPKPALEVSELEVVEDDPPEAAAPPRRRPPAETVPVSKDKDADKAHKRLRKKRSRESTADPGQARDMAAFYATSTAGDLSYRMAEANERKRKPEWKGMTILGLHFDGPLLIGTGMLVIGLLGLATLGAAYLVGIPVPSKAFSSVGMFAAGGVALIIRAIAKMQA